MRTKRMLASTGVLVCLLVAVFALPTSAMAASTGTRVKRLEKTVALQKRQIATLQQRLAGLTGSTGPMGPIGLTGPMGPIGLTGPIGLMGVPGLPGLPGPKGELGDVGPAGPAGVKGEQGEAGPIGFTGSQGPKGEIGATGPAGPVNPDADTLDGIHAAGFATAAHNHDTSYVGLGGSQSIAGSKTFTSAVRAPSVSDTDDPANFYLDPNAHTRLNNLTVLGTITADIRINTVRSSGGGTVLYVVDDGVMVVHDGATTWLVGGP